MFRKLYKRIFNSIFWLAWVFVVLLSAVSGFTVMRNLYKLYNTMAQSNVRQTAMYCDNYLNSVSNYTRSVAQKKDIISAVVGGDTAGVERLLATLVNAATDVAGAVLYGVNGQVFYSAGVGDVPSLNQLQQVDVLQSFFQSDSEFQIVVRNSVLPTVYNTMPYDVSQGVVSCVCKVYSENQAVGYLFADVPAESLFANKLAVDGYDNVAVAIGVSNVIVGYGDMPQENKLRNFYFVLPFADDGSVTFCLSMKDFYIKCTIIFCVLLLADVLCMVFVGMVAKHVATKVTIPLEQLRLSMQNEDRLV